jgi:hypothetical protein
VTTASGCASDRAHTHRRPHGFWMRRRRRRIMCGALSRVRGNRGNSSEPRVRAARVESCEVTVVSTLRGQGAAAVEGGATGGTGSGGGGRGVERAAGARWSGTVWTETGKSWRKERKWATGAHKQGRERTRGVGRQIQGERKKYEQVFVSTTFFLVVEIN